MKRKGNSRHWENLELRERYREAHSECELWGPLMEHVPDLIPGSVRRLWSAPSSTDLHHILHAAKERHDLWSNLIAVCRPLHDLDAQWKFRDDFKIACLWVKLRKSKTDPWEFDIEELNKSAGATRPSAMPVLHWLESHPSQLPSVNKMREELISRFNQTDHP